jgi:hypothetical protein
MTKITSIKTFDLRFPTSDHLDGSDAMNPEGSKVMDLLLQLGGEMNYAFLHLKL